MEIMYELADVFIYSIMIAEKHGLSPWAILGRQILICLAAEGRLNGFPPPCSAVSPKRNSASQWRRTCVRRYGTDVALASDTTQQLGMFSSVPLCLRVSVSLC